MDSVGRFSRSRHSKLKEIFDNSSVSYTYVPVTSDGVSLHVYEYERFSITVYG